MRAAKMGPVQGDASDLAEALEQVGDRWSLQVVAALAEGPRRFNELQAELPTIAPNVLSARLRQLEGAGLLVGRPYSRRPVRLQYQLTEHGHALRDVADALASWARQRRGDEAAVHQLCGSPLRYGQLCPACGIAVGGRLDDPAGEGESVML
jgi:DNA-binding HxlR family transcriptional regulator